MAQQASCTLLVTFTTWKGYYITLLQQGMPPTRW